MSIYTYIPFDVIDYKNENRLSSFSLKETPLKFVPNLNNTSKNVRLLWDFGDDTTSQSITGTKYYNNPGEYTVKLVVYDCFSNAELSTQQKNITIYDYINHTFVVDYSETDNIVWKNGKINGPLSIRTYFPQHIEQSSIFYDIEGSDSEFFFDVVDNRYSHLISTYSFFEKLTNFRNNTQYYDEISEIKPNVTKLYAKIEDNTLINCLSSDSDSFFVGVSGINDIYFRDDSVSDKIIINFYFDKTNTPTYTGGFSNNLSVSLSASITDNDDVSHLSITSNGVDGEFYSISSFNISDIKFANIDIPFVIKIKDSDNYSVKNFGLSSIDQFSISILSSGNPIPSSYYNLSSVALSGGSICGKISFDQDQILDSLSVSTSGVFINDQLSSFSLSGVSTTFTVYPQNYITLDKINEDFDFKEVFKNLRFQEFLIDKEILFEDFIGSIFGNIESPNNTLGKKVHEKISNFVDNNSNVDRNELFALLSHMDLLNVGGDEFDSSRFKFPESLKRLIDLASIDKNKLIGTSNKFSENFDIRGNTSKELYGRNLGLEINTDTYTISSNRPIVALENFSGEYTLLNTFQPPIIIPNESLSTESGDIIATESGSEITMEDDMFYMLSAFSPDWGWPLVIPPDFIYSDFPKYYTFFEYLSGFDNTTTNNTLLTSNQYNVNNLDDMFRLSFHDTLFQSLSIVK